MSSDQSNLSDKQFGYDMVVGVTQASVNATMKEWLSKVQIKPFILGYKFNLQASDPNHPYYPISDWDGFVKELGFDPFSLPDGTKDSDERMAKLLQTYFAFGFKAEIGLPDFPLDKIPPAISFDQEGSYVTYNMVNKVFQVIGIETPTYGPRTWLNASQADGSEVWDFQFTVNLNLQEGDLSNQFHLLPPETQQAIKNLGQDMFNVQQLFLDLNTAGLSKAHQIKGLKPTSTVYQMLCDVFFDEYFENLAKNGGVMLGFTVQAKQPFPDNGSLIPTDLNFLISAYTDGGKPTTDFNAYTLNYLIMSNGHIMPAPVPFTWNWVEKDQLSQEAGVMAINRNTFMVFLANRLSAALGKLAQKPTCIFDSDGLKVKLLVTFERDASSQTFQTKSDGATLLTYTYSSSDSAHHTINGWLIAGDWKVDYTASCSVSVSGTTITVVAKVNAYCYLEVDLGVAKGNWASYAITTTYTIGVTSQGKLVVSANDPQVQDNSEKPQVDVWSKIISAGTVNHLVNQAQGYLQPLLERFGTGFERDIADMLNGSSGWTFPGGRTYSFTGVQFSNYQDLVTELLYITPKTS